MRLLLARTFAILTICDFSCKKQAVLPNIILFLADDLGFSLILDQRFYTIETLTAGTKNHQR